MFPMVFDTFLPLKKRLEFGWTFETLWSSRCVHWILCSSCCIIVKTSSSDCHLLRFQSFDTLTSCSPWAVRSILLALTCPYFCGRTVWKIGGRSPKIKVFFSTRLKKLTAIILLVSSRFKMVFMEYGLPALTEVSRYELFGDGLCPQSGWWCLDKRPGWRPFRRLPWSTTLFPPNYIELGKPSLSYRVACWARPASNLQRQKASRWKEIVHKCPFLHHLKICFCSSGGASKMTPNNLLLGGIASRTSCTLHAIIIIIPLHKLRQRLLGSSGW